MRYTTLLVTDRGVRLADLHLRRLEPEGPEVADAFRAFAASAPPGVHALLADHGVLQVRPRPPSMLFDGMPVRFATSPLAGTPGPIDKPAPPSPFDAVRLPGVATLLTDAAGREILEACCAAVVAWQDGWVAPLADRPVVRSVALAAMREAMPVRLAPLPTDSRAPLLLLNAVVGACVPCVPGRAAPPQIGRAQV